MKRILSLFVVTLVMVSSCSKEAKLNRSLNGNWKLSTEDGVAVPTSGYTNYLTFSKDKKDNGTFHYEESESSSNYYAAIDGTYILATDKTITFTPKEGQGHLFVWTVEKYTKTELTFKDVTGVEYKYSPNK